MVFEIRCIAVPNQSIPNPFPLNRNSCAGRQEKTNALINVSVAIEACQLIVVVGANGSGKSTLVRILVRLLVYDSTTSQILIDGRPSNEYRVKNLHRFRPLTKRVDQIMWVVSAFIFISMVLTTELQMQERMKRSPRQELTKSR